MEFQRTRSLRSPSRFPLVPSFPLLEGALCTFGGGRPHGGPLHDNHVFLYSLCRVPHRISVSQATLVLSPAPQKSSHT